MSQGRLLTREQVGAVDRPFSVGPRALENTFAARFNFVLRYTPALWLGGLLALCTPMLVIYTFLRARCWKECLDPAIAGWFLIAVTQAISTVINWAETSEGTGNLIYRFFSAPISGWIFLGMLLAIGKHLRFDEAGFARSASILGLCVLCLGAPILAAGVLLNITDLEWLTPIGHLIPSSLPSAQFAFTAQFLLSDDFVGRTMPRLVLFYPWPTCLGLAGAAILFICLPRERSSLNWLGLCGGLFALLASTSRAAMVGTMIAVVAYVLLKQTAGRRPYILLGLITIISLCLYLPILFGTDPSALATELEGSVSGLRQESSSARQSLYNETLTQSLQQPYIGHGWQGDILEDTIPLPIGSHSTIYGLLYTGGALTLLPFVVTTLIVGARLLRNAVVGGEREHTALCIYIVLITMCYGECIYSFSIPVFFAFLGIGIGLRPSSANELTDALRHPVFLSKRHRMSGVV